MPTLFARCLVPMGVAALAGLCGLPGHAHAQCQYDVTVLQFPIDCGIGTVNTTGLSLNENGAVVGRYKCPISKYSQGFLWTAEGGFVGLEPPPGVIEVIPTGINDQGLICGTMIVADIGKRGFVYDHGEWTVLPPVVDMLGTWSSAAAISNDGVVVGQRSITENLNPQNAYIWSSEEGFTDLGAVEGPNSGAFDIANLSAVAGWDGSAFFADDSRAVIWDNAIPLLIGIIPGGFATYARGVTADGAVLLNGRIDASGSSVLLGYLWHNRDFTMIQPLPGYDTSGAADINDLQHVTGLCVNIENPIDRRAYLWDGANTHDLNDLIQPPPGDITIVTGKAINNADQLVADGNYQGANVTFLLAPVYQPLGDLNADCRVGILDLLRLLSDWGQADSPGDLNDDGIVNVFDLIILLNNWT